MTRAWVIILVMLGANVSVADGLGVLFSTPAQRTALDRLPLKHETPVAAEVPEVAAEAAAKEAPMKKVKIGGMIVNSQGKNTTWINQEGDKKVKATGVSAGHVEVTLGPDGKHISLKPGQEFDPETGKIRETYQGASDAKPLGSGACRSSKTPEGELHIICEPPSAKP